MHKNLRQRDERLIMNLRPCCFTKPLGSRMSWVGLLAAEDGVRQAETDLKREARQSLKPNPSRPQ